MKHLHIGIEQKCADLSLGFTFDLTDTDVYKMGTEPKIVVSLLIQLLRKWKYPYLSTEPKTVVQSLIQLLGKCQHLHLEQSPRRS